MSTDDIGWDVQSPIDLSIDGVPADWNSFTKAAKIQRLLDVILEQLRKVRSGNFNAVKGERVAALALECQLELSDLYADVEAMARNAKHEAEYAEGEVAAQHAKEAVAKEVRVSEASLKRVATISDEVKAARSSMIQLERDHRKWRYVYETVKEAHIFFRNIGKL